MKLSVLDLAMRIIVRIRKRGVFNTISLISGVARRSVMLLFLPYRINKRIAECSLELKNGLNILSTRVRTLSYTESMRLQGNPYGQYKYAGCQLHPVLYASVFAALIRHLYRDLTSLTTEQRNEWIGYIKSFQCEDGWFRDSVVDCELADSVGWWGWQHLTFLAVMALTCLGGVADKGFKILEPFKEEAYIEDWFNSLHIRQDLSPLMNAHLPLYVVTLLQYARDYQNVEWADSAVRKIITLLNREQDPKTGCWCTSNGRQNMINEGVKIAYHFWVLYFYDKYPIDHLEAAIDSILSTQNEFGGFDHLVNSSACDDIDSIDPLCRMMRLTDYRKTDITNSLLRAVPWILANMNEDGGFVFKRGEQFQYGHEKMYSGKDESNMFATWFRTLSLAYIGRCFPYSWPSGFDWHFEEIPGLQFWRE